MARVDVCNLGLEWAWMEECSNPSVFEGWGDSCSKEPADSLSSRVQGLLCTPGHHSENPIAMESIGDG